MKHTKESKRRIQDAEASQRRLDIAARAGVLEAIRQGLDDVAHGRSRPAREVFAEIRRKRGVPEAGRDAKAL